MMRTGCSAGPKIKWMKIQYKCVHNTNKKFGAKRQSIPFSEELSHFFSMDRAITTSHMYSTTGELEESLAGASLEEEVQGGPRMKVQSGAWEQVPGVREVQGMLMGMVPKVSGLLVLVPSSSQDLRVKVHLQLDLNPPHIFSGTVE